MTHRVLLVDDDDDVRDAIAESIRLTVGCEVHEAADRVEALALLECYTYSLVMTDISFTRGRKEGLDLVEHLVALPSRPAVFALSGEPDACELALSLGADKFLAKPLRLSDIATALRGALENSAHVQRSPIANKSVRLDGVLSGDQLRMYAQPIYQIDASSAKLHAVEFLTRGPKGTLFERPDVLFSYARAAHAEDQLDRCCIEKALTAAVELPEGMRFSLNVHASTLCKPPDFARWLEETAAAHAIDVHRITVEIVELSPAWNHDVFLKALEQLRGIGARIALDDIGLGHSNYQMMVDVRPDYFKLDRYFVNGCSTDRYRRAVVASVAKLALEFGATVIAEGAEDPRDVQELQSQGVRFVQSFLYCRPLPVSEALAKVFPDEALCGDSAEEKRAVEPDCSVNGLGYCIAQ